jgi:general stress protein 26
LLFSSVVTEKGEFVKNGLKNSTENLHIVGDIIEAVRVGMLTTMSRDGLPSSRPMFVQEVDEQGQIWFFTSTTSKLVEQVRFNPQVQVTFADSGKNKFLTALAVASEIHDISKMQELWDPTLKAWFREGLETPGIVLLKLNMQEAEYWDSPHSPVVRITGLVKAMMSDQPYQPGRHERVDLRH